LPSCAACASSRVGGLAGDVRHHPLPIGEEQTISAYIVGLMTSLLEPSGARRC
jgi:hypothetical protein